MLFTLTSKIIKYMNNDCDDDGNNIVPCPICLNVYCPSKEGGKCPEEEEFVSSFEANQD